MATTYIDLGFSSYSDYLDSPHWQEFRKTFFASERKKTCHVCGRKDVDLHHKTYKRLGRERLDEVIPLCRDHHEKVHEVLKKKKWCVERTDQVLALLMNQVGKHDLIAELTKKFPGLVEWITKMVNKHGCGAVAIVEANAGAMVVRANRKAKVNKAKKKKGRREKRKLKNKFAALVQENAEAIKTAVVLTKQVGEQERQKAEPTFYQQLLIEKTARFRKAFAERKHELLEKKHERLSEQAAWRKAKKALRLAEMEKR